MKLASPQLEGRLRRAVRREIRRSPELRRRYRAEHSVWKQLFLPSWKESQFLDWCVGGFFHFVILTVILVGVDVQAHANPQLAPAVADRLALVSHCLLITSIVLSITYGDRSRFQTANLAAYACLPVDDHRLVQSKSWGWLYTAAVLTYLGVLPPLMLIARHQLAGEALHTGAVVVIIQWLVTLSCALIAVSYSSPCWGFLRTTVLLFLLGAALPFFASWIPVWLAWPLSCVIYLTPPGWVDAALVHGLVEGRAWAWWFLSPALAIVLRAVPLAVERARARFAFWEFENYRDSAWAAYYETGFRVPDDFDLQFRRMWIPSEELDRFKAERERDVEQDWAAEVRRTDFSRLADAEGATCGDRLALALLTPRQRILFQSWTFDFFSSWRLRLLSRLPKIALPLGLLGGVGFAFGFGNRTFVVCLGVVLLLADSCFTGVSRTRLVAHLPVALDEVCWTMLRRGVVRTLVLLPLMLTYGIAGMWVVGAPLWQGVLLGLFLALAYVCLQPLLVCVTVARATRYSRQKAFCAGWYALLLLPAAALVFRLRLESLPQVAVLLLAAAYVVGPLLLWRHYVRAYNRGRIDLVVRQREE